MASQFSWSDSLQAVFASCLYCLQSPTDADRDHNDNQGTLRPRNGLNYTIPPPRARPDELEGLLADADSTDAETLSLHSNLGDERRRRKRRHPRKGIRLFGWDLFGRPPIHLAESDEEGDGQGRSERRSRTISSSTLDSDAAPLDASTIEHLSAARLAEATAAAEEERRRAKEERHRLRRERKELKRMAAAMAMGMHRYGEEEFEGFPGSGYAGPQLQGPGSGSGSMSPISSPYSSPFTEEFGPFAQGQSSIPEDDDADGADFGAESYTRRSAHGAASETGSGSRSASNSNSNTDPSRYTRGHISQQLTQLPSPTFPGASGEPQRKKKRRSTKLRPLSSKHSDSPSTTSQSPSLNTSQSPSLSSPSADHSSFSPDIAFPTNSQTHLMHSMDGQFEGFPGDTLDIAHEYNHKQKNLRLTSEGSFPSTGLPSIGLHGVQRVKSDMGVFLARRGEE
ncbi:hypothetical protein AcV7_001747 [Taiwanofungus camphoratus]|nr:hypothetical protein AcV7_001747 [Antrodia cinnamomea]